VLGRDGMSSPPACLVREHPRALICRQMLNHCLVSSHDRVVQAPLSRRLVLPP
jgi:hypothetical protein